MARKARMTWGRALELLVAVRLGQELGTDSEIAQTVAHSLDFVVSALSRFFS
jgi:hypothetical protein